jgi:hypothetical protein
LCGSTVDREERWCSTSVWAEDGKDRNSFWDRSKVFCRRTVRTAAAQKARWAKVKKAAKPAVVKSPAKKVAAKKAVKKAVKATPAKAAKTVANGKDTKTSATVPAATT